MAPPLENTTLTAKVLIVPCEVLRRIENSPRALNWLSHGRCSFEERPFERQQSWFRNINLIACEENPWCYLSKPECQEREVDPNPNTDIGPSKDFSAVKPSYRFRLTHGQKQSPWNPPPHSTLKIFTWIIATTTKISTKGCSTLSQENASPQPLRCLSLLERDYSD